uniref:Uncharacterized protein n=1 Tax=Rhizophora mucronata TaxID=61149 RepID=A0A2P2PZ22_RHIMU
MLMVCGSFVENQKKKNNWLTLRVWNGQIGYKDNYFLIKKVTGIRKIP